MRRNLSLFKVINSKSSLGFIIAVIIGLAFSMAVILSTIGLMDGFEKTLREALKQSNSDFIITKQDGFFLSNDILPFVEKFQTTAVLQVEAFAVGNNKNRGVLLKGVEEETFRKVTGVNISFETQGVYLGEKLLADLDLKINDEVLLTFASSSLRDQASAIMRKFKILGFVTHGIHEKDLRIVYIAKQELEKILAYKSGSANQVLVKDNVFGDEEVALYELNMSLPEDFKVIPYWNEYKTLISAVEVEKNSIMLILQVIVIVSVFNVLGLIIYLFERRSRDFFLIRAIGVSLRTMSIFWTQLLISIWFAACVLSFLFTNFFNFLLKDLNILNIPGEIYVLSQLQLVLRLQDYILVYLIALLWIFLIGAFVIRRLRTKSLLQGLRQEFR